MLQHAQMQFDMLFGGYEDDSAQIEIRPRPPKWAKYPAQGRAFFPVAERTKAAECALSLSDRFDVYFSVLPRHDNDGKASSITQAGSLWIDADGGEEGVSGAVALMKRACQRGIPRPNLAVCSGNGLHCYWILKEIVSLVTIEEKSDLVNVLKRLNIAIGGTPPQAHADIARADIATVPRVAGTLNLKERDNAKCVKIISCDETRERFSLTKWQAILPALPLPRRDFAPLREDYLDNEKRPLPEKAKRLLGAPVMEGSRHRAANSLIASARSCGFSEESAMQMGLEFCERNGFPQREMLSIIRYFWKFKTR